MQMHVLNGLLHTSEIIIHYTPSNFPITTKYLSLTSSSTTHCTSSFNKSSAAFSASSISLFSVKDLFSRIYSQMKYRARAVSHLFFRVKTFSTAPSTSSIPRFFSLVGKIAHLHILKNSTLPAD
jgi:hypothetical protein